jgi:hypothetical protein
MYSGGTINAFKPGDMGMLDTEDNALVFTAQKGNQNINIPYDSITAMDYGEHAGRRVGATVALGVTTLGIMALPMLFSKKKRHYLTIYFNKDSKAATEERARLSKDAKAVPKGDVAVFEINKNDYSKIMATLQAKTGVAIQVEKVNR